MSDITQTAYKNKEDSLGVKYKVRSWYRALKNSTRSALHLDRSQLTTIQAVRSSLGIGLPLILGVLTNNLVVGVSIAGGAASLAGVGLNSTHKARARLMLWTCLGVAVSAFVGNITSHVAWLSVIVAGVWGIIAGMLVAFGQSGMVIGLQLGIAMIILTHFALEPVDAALQAALMFGGALFQTALAVIPLPLRITAPERTILADLYRQLGAYILSSSNEVQARPPVREALQKAHTTLSDLNQHRQTAQIFFALLEEAEHIRLNLIILSRIKRSLNLDEVEQQRLDEKMEALFQVINRHLEEIADELKITSRLNRKARTRLAFKPVLAAIRASNGPEQIVQQILDYSATLRDQLHTTRKLAKSWKYGNPKIPYDLHLIPSRRQNLKDLWATVSSNFTFRSVVFRHAIRLGVALALATALYRLVPLPLQRGYWIPLTALLVLKPDFKTTFTRGVARLLGTMLGAALTTLLLVVLAPSTTLLAIMTTLMAYLAFSVLFVNYALFSVFVTVEVVFLLTLVLPQPLETVAYRSVDTAIGGLLALLIYVLWPSWERDQLADNLAACLDNTRNYFDAILEAYSNPATYDEAKIQKLRQEGRLAYSNAAASVERALQEPAQSGFNPELGQGLLQVRDRLIDSILTLDAHFQANSGHEPVPQAAEFKEKVDEVLNQFAEMLRQKATPASPPAFQNILHGLDSARKTGDKSEAGITNLNQLLQAEAKRIIESLKAMRQLLCDGQP